MSDDPGAPITDEQMQSLSVKAIRMLLQQRLGDQLDQTEQIIIEPYKFGQLVGVAIVINTDNPVRNYTTAGSLQDAIDDPDKFADAIADKLLNMIRAA